jgi:hypothetical protein
MITQRFSTLAEAEVFLQYQGLHLISDSCDWTSAAGDDAGVYPIYGRYGEVLGWRAEINPAYRANDISIIGQRRP